MTKSELGHPASAYQARLEILLGRAVSMLDAEPTSVSHGSFDRTWWCWKFSDFSASRFQEGVFTLGWLATSPFAPPRFRRNARLIENLSAAIRFWTTLQHSDGSFDEAYPFERSLAATAFTGFYVGCGLERTRNLIPADVRDAGLQAVESGARWLATNGEYHGVLSNHLAAAAGALQIAGDLLGTDRFKAARDRYLGIIYANQDPEEGWMREYSGADPGYQSHGMFYLAEIWRRTSDAELLERLDRGARFLAWFVHPDGTIGGEYASRGTKFTYPAAFEMLAGRSQAAAAIAAHLRERIAAGRGVGPGQMDAWNLFPLLNNHLFATDAAQQLPIAELPWMQQGASALFERAGIVTARRGDRVLVAGLGLGGALKVWNATAGDLVYEDCGYATTGADKVRVSQSKSQWSQNRTSGHELSFEIEAAFIKIPAIRFDPYLFWGFRAFSLTVGRVPTMARWLKSLLVRVLINRKKQTATEVLKRTIRFDADGTLVVEDRIAGLQHALRPLDRHVPFHMGSTRYSDLNDWSGAQFAPPVSFQDSAEATRRVTLTDTLVVTR